MYTRSVYGRRNGAYNYSEFIVDSEADIGNLPTISQSGTSGNQIYNSCSVGSKALIVDQKKMYVMNNEGIWKPVLNYAVSGGSGGTTSFGVEDDGMGNVSII